MFEDYARRRKDTVASADLAEFVCPGGAFLDRRDGDTSQGRFPFHEGRGVAHMGLADTAAARERGERRAGSEIGRR